MACHIKFTMFECLFEQCCISFDIEFNNFIKEPQCNTIVVDAFNMETKTFYLDKPKFEQAFLDNFTKNKNIKTKSSQVEFSYLPSKYSDDGDAISGAKVKIVSDGQTYQGTMLIDTGRDK